MCVCVVAVLGTFSPHQHPKIRACVYVEFLASFSSSSLSLFLSYSRNLQNLFFNFNRDKKIDISGKVKPFERRESFLSLVPQVIAGGLEMSFENSNL